MLVKSLGNRAVKDILLPSGEYRPFPKILDRESWDNVTSETKASWINAAEKYFDYKWPALTADKFIHFYKTGENTPYLFDSFERRSVLGIFVLAECIENKGRFYNQIVNGIYCICEETTWMTPYDLKMAANHVFPESDDVIVDLACSQAASLLAYTYYLLKEELDKIHPAVCERIKKEIDKRAIEPYLNRDDYWWMGFVPNTRINNWNPWCNRNILACLLLVADEDKRNIGVEKAMRSLDRYILTYSKDGCCDEGPSYWGAAGGGLNSCLEFLKTATNGAIDIFDEEIIKDIGRYIYKAYIHDNYYVNFADGDAKIRVGGASYDYGKNIGDEKLVALGASKVSVEPTVYTWFGMYEFIKGIVSEKERNNDISEPPYIVDSWMPYTQVMTARETEGTEKGFFIAAKAGYNAESHNHNDVGNFVVYIDGKPLVIDVGTEEYTAKTFGKDRFTLWYLQSQYHNCPTINGVLQHDGIDYKAKNVEYRCDGDVSEISMDLAEAYPKESGAREWIRQIGLNRKLSASVEIVDKYNLYNASPVQYHFMCAVEPRLTENGFVEMEYSEGKFVEMNFDNQNLDINIEKMEMTESRLNGNWGDALYRITLLEKNPQKMAERLVRFYKK